MPSGGNNKIDLIGKKFTHLTVIKKALSSKRKLCNWICRCSCGNYRIFSGYYLRQGRKRSCGCKNTRLLGSKNPRWSGYKNICGSYWHSIKQGAKARKLEMEISIKDVWLLFIKQNKKCALSGITLKMCASDKERRLNLSKQTASLDRIDSKQGYIKGNLQWIHKDLNRIKMDLDNAYFIELCKKVAKYNK